MLGIVLEKAAAIQSKTLMKKDSDTVVFRVTFTKFFTIAFYRAVLRGGSGNN